MNNWGFDPDVALFIGGPKDGLIENIRGKRSQRYVIQEDYDAIYLMGSLDPVRMVPRYRYGSYEPAVVVIDGQKYTAMADPSEYDFLEISQRVEDELHQQYSFGGVVTSIPLSSYTFTYDQIMQWANNWKSVGWITEEMVPDNRTDEEKLAWVTEGEGVDFL